MSDLFTRLAERAIGHASIVQPMIASLYATEPLQTEEPLSLELVVEQEAGEARKRAPLSSPLNQAQAPLPPLVPTRERADRSASAPHPAEETVIKPPASERVLERSVPAQRNQTPLLAHPTEQAQGAEVDTDTNAPLSVSVQRQPEARPLPDLSLASELPEPSTRRVIPTRVPEEQKPEYTTHAAMQSETAGMTHAAQRDQVPASPAVSPTAPKPVVRERIHTVLVEKQRAEETNVPAHISDAPTVQVTIGRIEVRAIHTPLATTHQQQKKTTPAMMSLDDYLHQRAKGERA